MFWLRRDSLQITVCDPISKDFDPSDYALRMDCFFWLESMYGPFEANYFASSSSFRFKPFFSRFSCSEAAGTDAFSVRWGKGVGYFHPPVSLVVRVLRYAKECGATGLWVVPDWSSSTWRPVLDSLVKDRKIKMVERFRLKLVTSDYIQSNTFRGMLKFDFLALFMRF